MRFYKYPSQSAEKKVTAIANRSLSFRKKDYQTVAKILEDVRRKGDAAVINDYKARMLASPKSRKVLDSILNAALDDDHKNQAAAWKLCMDRLLPVSYFEKDKASGGKSAINISITGVGGETTVISGGEEPIEGDYTDVWYKSRLRLLY